MPKMKGHKGLAKRIKLTATGKLMRRRCGGSHLMSGKSAKRRRRIASTAIMAAETSRVVRIRLPK
ncbi:MAG TPA: 50S ribosomal protein L35 [Sedimentisphaerales bacterium]|nr:50S ribosomal protein L35 [Sedimentisphaerales bacterium]